MPRQSKLIDEEVVKLANNLLAKMGNNAKGVIKLKAIVAAKEHGIKDVAKIFNVTRNTISSWVKKLKTNPAGIFEIASGRGRKNTLTNEQLSQVKKWIESDSSITIKEVIIKIFDNFGINLHKSAVHQIMNNLSFSYITARPRHYKQDKSKHEEFKKKSH